ncbi:MAG: MBL fold metallo-hydrolase [Bacteroidota bacterium]
MKKIVKRGLIFSGIVLIALIVLVVIYGTLANSELKKMNTIPTGEIVENIFAVQESYVNMYLIKDDSNYIAIDAGNDIDVVAGSLKKMNINPDRVVAVLLTHSDSDHSAAISLFNNAKIYFSLQEEKLLTGEKSRFLFFGNKIDAKQYTLIKDQAIFSIGNIRIKGLLTQGHTYGSMCYLINDKYLFIGDALSLKDGKIDEFPSLFNTDSKTAKKSISKLTNLPHAAYIFTAHFGYSSDYQEAVKDWKN